VSECEIDRSPGLTSSKTTASRSAVCVGATPSAAVLDNQVGDSRVATDAAGGLRRSQPPSAPRNRAGSPQSVDAFAQQLQFSDAESFLTHHVCAVVPLPAGEVLPTSSRIPAAFLAPIPRTSASVAASTVTIRSIEPKWQRSRCASEGPTPGSACNRKSCRDVSRFGFRSNRRRIRSCGRRS
jgi:hypothetical protein